MIVTETKLVN